MDLFSGDFNRHAKVKSTHDFSSRHSAELNSIQIKLKCIAQTWSNWNTRSLCASKEVNFQRAQRKEEFHKGRAEQGKEISRPFTIYPSKPLRVLFRDFHARCSQLKWTHRSMKWHKSRRSYKGLRTGIMRKSEKRPKRSTVVSHSD